jgi:hypothetical protein
MALQYNWDRPSTRNRSTNEERRTVMNPRHVVLVATLLVAAGGTVWLAASSQERGPEPASKVEREQRAGGAVERERPVALEDLPAAVKEVVLERAGAHPIREIEEIQLGNARYYEAEWLDQGMEIEIAVAPDGTVLGINRETPDDDVDGDDAGRDDARDDDRTGDVEVAS